MLPVKPADAAAEGEAGDPGVGDDPARRREPERLGLAVHVAPKSAGLDPRGPRLRVDADPLHQPRSMTIPPSQTEWPGKLWPRRDRDSEPTASRKLDGSDHVRHACAARDQRRRTVDRPVPDSPVLVIGRVAGPTSVPRRTHRTTQCALVELDLSGEGTHRSDVSPRRLQIPAAREKGDSSQAMWKAGSTPEYLLAGGRPRSSSDRSFNHEFGSPAADAYSREIGDGVAPMRWMSAVAWVADVS